MKTTLISLLLLASTSCTYATLKYGYYWNPVTVLSLANEALETNSKYDWNDLFSGNALCIYGTKEGMNNVRSTLEKVDESSLQEPARISANYLATPGYIGYFTYYQETYVSKAMGINGKLLLKVKILCNFGKSENDRKYLNAPLSQYTVRSCSIVEIKNFDNPIRVASYCVD